MNLELSGRVALVTGASSGIGAGIARALAAEGARVAVSGRDAGRVEAMAQELGAGRGSPANALGVVADLTQRADLARLVSEVQTGLGPIGILVHCAGASQPAKPDSPDALWDESFALNFTAARLLAQAVLPHMTAAGWGRIITVSGSMEPRSLNAAIAAKAALHLWAKGLSCDVARDGITVNTIAPGRIHSRQVMQTLHPSQESRDRFAADNIPAGYFGEPEDVGNLAAYLASPLARYITGSVIPVDGGMHRFAH